MKGVLDDGDTLDHLLERDGGGSLNTADRALARAIAATTLRRKGQIDKVLAQLMQKPLGKRGGDAMHILRVASAQILFMDVPDHASVSLAMDIAKADHKARHFSKLINGVLRSLTRQRDEIIANLLPRDILPDWLCESWGQAYGAINRNQMAEALCSEPYLDIRTKGDPGAWVKTLDGMLLKSGTIRLKTRGAVRELEGFKEGEWWVQDIAASLVTALFGDVTGRNIADLCAAPGGKSAYLCARGASVTAVDISADRLTRLKDNLDRLKLTADVVQADILAWQPDQLFDGVLLDAPCSATGTARKHPDALWLKTAELPRRLVGIQRSLLKKATGLLKPGGTLIYATCSLQQEEGEEILDFIRDENLPLTLDPIAAHEVFDISDIIRNDGTIRILPHHKPFDERNEDCVDDPCLLGMDGFFIVRMRKTVV